LDDIAAFALGVLFPTSMDREMRHVASGVKSDGRGSNA
jgi:hypothetical protein